MLSTEPFAAFQNIEPIIKHFYDRFKVERTTFQAYLQNTIPPIPIVEQEQLASLLLNRLMFIYFLQKQGFLNGDQQYLSHHLELTQIQVGNDRFYDAFLSALFHQGLGTPNRSTESQALLGNVPYLGGSLFTRRALEDQYPNVLIPDAAFVRLFTFFDLYRWHLDEPKHPEKELLTPDVLGYIFEQYVNQQQMGAYYTREDVTRYISNNTIIPSLFDTLALQHPEIFATHGTIWQLLCEQPQRYIYAPMANQAYLADETPRDYDQRRRNYIQIVDLINDKRLCSIDDLITYNLHISRFAVDAIHTLTDPALLLTCYQSLSNMTILDPTCGSGAFLMAALSTLLPLYEACLECWDTITAKDREHHSLLTAAVIQPSVAQLALNALANQRSARRYTILKTIITHNLYGIDIMEEATEICKLHLFLTLIAQVKHPEDIEPLLNIDHNIHTGNTLLAKHESLVSGGFKVIIGNPPYVEYNQQTFSYTLNHFSTRSCANLYTCVAERSRHWLSPQGRQGMILPLAAFSTKNMQPFLTAFRHWFPVSWLSFYHFRPSMLFSGGKVANIPTAIYLAKVSGEEQRFSTHLLKWTQEQRPLLFSRLMYHRITAPIDPLNCHYYPKFSQNCEDSILRKILIHPPISNYISRHPNTNTMFYRTAGGLYWKVFVNFPWPYHTTSNKQCFFQTEYQRDIFVALFNSSLFWWYYTVTFDTFNLKDYMLFGFRFSYPSDPDMLRKLEFFSQRLMEDFCRHAKHLKRGQTGSYTIYARRSKAIIDAIDHILARHYGFSPEELDFILSYDIKYRMGLPQIGEANE